MTDPAYTDDQVTVYAGDCLTILRADENGYDHTLGYGTRRLIPDNSVDAVVTDPPYGLEFMGKEWDRFGGDARQRNDATFTTGDRRHGLVRHGVGASYGGDTAKAMQAFQAWCELWATECLRVLKPGGHLLAFGGTRTSHRLTCAIEDAGFEIRDSIAWLHSQGFPKNLNVSKALNDHRCRATKARPVRSPLRSGQPRLEGRSDTEAAEGQLQGSPLRPLPTRVPADGTQGRLHRGAPSSDGSVGGPDADPPGVREPQGPQSLEQRPLESGVVSDERRSQAWGGWPVCERCSQPVIPDGLGTAAKPAHEPVVVARKPPTGTVAGNVQVWGTGALNIDACRIGEADGFGGGARATSGFVDGYEKDGFVASTKGRWPANVVLDESQAAALDQQSGTTTSGRNGVSGSGEPSGAGVPFVGDSGGASRFFYVAKADASQRPRNGQVAHPTVKPLALMRWLVRLVTPPGGLVLDPFAGSGTTAEACIHEHMRCITIEREPDYLPLIVARLTKPMQVGFDLGVLHD